MAFDLGNVKSIGLPVWLRVAVGIIVIAAIGADVWLGIAGFRDPSRKDWLNISIQLSATLLPLLIGALLFNFSTTGTETLRRKTSDILLKLIPDTIKYAATTVPEFADMPGAHGRKFRPLTEVSVAYHPCDFYCRYRITFPDVWTSADGLIRRIAYLIIDLKVSAANMHLCIPSRQLDRYLGPELEVTAEKRSGAFRQAFQQTLAGAETAGCKVNERVAEFDLDNEHLCCLIVVRTLSPTFLSDPA